MKKLFFAGAAVLLMSAPKAQQKEGKVIYERTMQVQIQINDNGNDALQQMLPKSRTDKFELSFGNNQSIYKHVDEDQQSDEVSGAGMQIKMMGPGMDDIIFCDFDKAYKTEQRVMFEKKFLVPDSIRKLNWKLGEDTKTILGYTCHKAVSQRTGKRTTMNINNGVMEKKEISDTTAIVAWFTTDIPVSAGPEVPGQLPGIILALDMNDGRMTYVAKEISPKVDLASIKEPTKGKKVTPDEFVVERNKMMDEMQKNNQGGNGNRVIRIQN
jgi:GLPGLI family protein